MTYYCKNMANILVILTILTFASCRTTTASITDLDFNVSSLYFIVHKVHTEGIEIIWSDNSTNNGKFDNIVLQTTPAMSNGTDVIAVARTVDQNRMKLIVSPLTSGTEYTFNIYVTNKAGARSASAINLNSFTRPTKPSTISIPVGTVYETNFTVHFNQTDDRFDCYVLLLCITGETLECDRNKTIGKNDTSTVVGNMTAATLYTVMLYTASPGQGDTFLLSSEAEDIDSFTSPLKPIVTIYEVRTDSIALNLSLNEFATFGHYVIYVFDDENMLMNITVPKEDKVTTIGNLTAGSMYNIRTYTSVFGVQSEHYSELSSPTIPTLPVNNTTIINVTDNGFTLQYNDNQPEFLYWIANITSDGFHVHSRNTSKNNATVYIGSLQSGTNYSIQVYTAVPGFHSRDTILMSTFTRPTKPSAVAIPAKEVYNNNFTVFFNQTDERFDSFLMILCKNDDTEIKNETIEKQKLSTVVVGLDAATNYSVKLYTQRQGGNSLLSLDYLTVSSYTSPLEPTVKIGQIKADSIEVVLNGNEQSTFDHFSIIVTKDGIVLNNITVSKQDNMSTIGNLSPGTTYTFHIFTLLFGIQSEHFSVLSSTTQLKATGVVMHVIIGVIGGVIVLNGFFIVVCYTWRRRNALKVLVKRRTDTDASVNTDDNGPHMDLDDVSIFDANDETRIISANNTSGKPFLELNLTHCENTHDKPHVQVQTNDNISNINVRVYEDLARFLETPMPDDKGCSWWRYILGNEDLKINETEEMQIEQSVNPGMTLLDLFKERDFSENQLKMLFVDLKMTDALRILE